MFQAIINEFINFVLPNSCLVCGASIDASERFICKNCSGKLEPYNQTHPWQDEYKALGIIDNSLSAYWFRADKELQPLLHAMKYQKMRSVGRMLGRDLGKLIAAKNTTPFDLVIPVPLHKAKFRDRTYNQSDFIAEGINDIIRAKVITGAIKRTRFTPSQTKLDKAARKENVSDAFAVNPKHAGEIKGKHIIVVDDVITTGATILECCGAVKQAGAGKVWAVSAAYAELKMDD
ncbi:MAG: ComF family protein [Ignavibacteria bacterium]|nr:ComF family protein [Ignavibacteria bacterium]